MSTVYSWRLSEEFEPSSLSICCTVCENPLVLHQPDSDTPDRLLATCEDCKAWFLANGDGTVLIPLPAWPADVDQSGVEHRSPLTGVKLFDHAELHDLDESD